MSTMFHQSTSSSQSPTLVLKSSESGNVLLRSLQRFYAEKKLFDCSITCNGQILFGCHKLVLAACSSYFETLLTDTDGFAILNLDAVDSNFVRHLSTIVNFMYGHNVEVPSCGPAFDQIYEAARIFGATAMIKLLDLRPSSTISSFPPAKKSKSTIWDFGEVKEENVIVLRPAGIGSMLLINFQRFKNDGKFIDAKICCRDEVLFKCHKLALASFSAYFETLLHNTEGSAILNLDAVDALYVEQLSTIIDYMYGKTTWIKLETVDLLRDAAHVFGVQALEGGGLARMCHYNERIWMKKLLNEKLHSMREKDPEKNKKHGTGRLATNINQLVTVAGSLRFRTQSSDASTSESDQIVDDGITTATNDRTAPSPSLGAVEETVGRRQLNLSHDHPTGRPNPNRKRSKRQHHSPIVTVSTGVNVMNNIQATSGPGVLSNHHLCFQCGETFDSKSSLEIHHLDHTVITTTGSTNHSYRLKCAECPSKYFNVTSLRSHWEKMHGSEQRNRGCFICGLVFENKDMLKNHVENMHLSTAQKNSMSTKYPESVDAKKLVCRVCGFMGSTLSAFMEHVDEKHISTDAVCHVCGETFANRQALNLHCLNEHDMPVHVCSICGKCFKTSAGYQYHVDTHGQGHRCEYCSFFTSAKKNLDVHVKKYHPKTSGNQTDDEEANHTNSDHLPHKCTECSAAFLYECLLNRHYQKRHLKVKPYQCPFCGHSTTEKGALQTHIRMHTNEEPYACDMCDFKCKTSSILKRHTRTHTGEKPHVCGQCGAAFTEKRDLTSHRWKVHEKIRPFQCEICNVGFLRKDNLLQHQRLKHGPS